MPALARGELVARGSGVGVVAGAGGAVDRRVAVTAGAARPVLGRAGCGAIAVRPLGSADGLRAPSRGWYCWPSWNDGAATAKAHAESEFEKYRIVQDRLFESDFDRVVAETKRLSEGTSKETPRKGGKP